MPNEFSNEKKGNISIWIPLQSEFIEQRKESGPFMNARRIPPQSEDMKPQFSSKFHVDGYAMP